MATPSVTYTFAPNTLIKASEANTNFQDIIDFLTNEVIQKDGSTAFTVTPSGPSTDPTADDQSARKAYVDSRVKTGTTTVTMSLSSSEGVVETTVTIPGITTAWPVFAQLRQSGQYAGGSGVTSAGRACEDVTFAVWTRSAAGVAHTYTIDYVAINPS